MAIFDRPNLAEKKTQEPLVSSSEKKVYEPPVVKEVPEAVERPEEPKKVPAKTIVKDAIEIAPEAFGELYRYIADETIVNVDYNGRSLVIEEASGRRRDVGPLKDPNMIPSLCSRIKNGSRVKEFNKENPVLEAF